MDQRRKITDAVLNMYRFQLTLQTESNHTRLMCLVHSRNSPKEGYDEELMSDCWSRLSDLEYAISSQKRAIKSLESALEELDE